MTATSSHTVDRYWLDLERAASQPMTREQERAAFARVAAGDDEARQQVIEANLRFVVQVARQYDDSGLPMEDRVAEGNLGLMVAVDRFDPERGHKFISYAVWWIRQRIQDAIGSQVVVRRPQNARADWCRLDAARTRLTAQLGRAPTRTEVEEAAGMSDGQLRTAALASGAEISLQAPHDGDPGLTLESSIGSEDPEPDETPRFVSLLMAHVTDSRDRYILTRYYGLDGEVPMTLQEIGYAIGITRERVRQLKFRALCELRKVAPCPS